MKGAVIILAVLFAGVAAASLLEINRSNTSFEVLPDLRQASSNAVAFVSTEAGHESCVERAVFGDPADSLYVLPYPVGTSYPVLQSC